MGARLSVLETGRLRLRQWVPEDAARVLDIYRRWEVARWLGTTPSAMADLDEAARAVERWISGNAGTMARVAQAVEGPAVPEGRWAVERRADAVVVGTALLVPLPGGDGELEVGWHLHPDAWGHGYATEAARGLTGRAFGAGLGEVLAVVRPGNEASVAVCRRLGMQALGLTDRFYQTSLELFRLRAPGRTR